MHKRRRHSLFFKLILVYVGLGVLAFAIVSSGMRNGFSNRPALQLAASNARNYLHYLVDDLGEVPTSDKVKKIEADTGLRLRVESATSVIGEDLPSVATLRGYLRMPPWWPKGRVEFGRYEDKRHFLIYPTGAYTVAFVAPGIVRFDVSEGILFATLAGLLLVIAVAYKLTQRMLRPVGTIADGLRRFGAGDLEMTVKAKGRDELADVAHAFNDMTAKIRGLIASKEQLLSDVSHELRTPLTRMKLGLELLPKGEARQSLAGDVGDMEHLVQLILDSAKLDNGQPLAREPVDLMKIAASVVPHDVIVVRQGAPAPVTGDANWLKIAIRNLVDNAVKYSDGAKEPVTVVVRHASVIVTDHGIGIPAGELERIFEPFYRVDPSRVRKTGGLGLGLHIVRKVARAHGGDVTVVSEPGNGSTFTLTIGES